MIESRRPLASASCGHRGPDPVSGPSRVPEGRAVRRATSPPGAAGECLAPRPVRLCLLLLLASAAATTLRPGVAQEPVHGGPAAALLCIVAPGSFLPALDPFIAHKRKSLRVEPVALEGVLRGEGADDPERLKRFLFAAWRERGLRYVLLVGDAALLPVRYMTLDRNTEAAFNYAFYPSDLYYADLARADGSFDDWNADQDGFHAGYYGEVNGEHNKTPPINADGVHYLPRVAVGRWPVRTAEEARRVAQKTVAFESAAGEQPMPARLRTAVFVCGGGWVDARPLFRRLADELGAGWTTARLFYRDAGSNEDTPPPNEAELLKRVRAGCGFVFHGGHGSDTAWDGCLSTGSLPKLADAPGASIFFSAGCSTACFAALPPYDGYRDVNGVEHQGTNAGEVFRSPPPFPAPYQGGKFSHTGLGQELLRPAQGGAVAYLGCNTGSQPCALTLMEGFVEALARPQGERERLGDLWCRALEHYHRKERLDKLVPTDDWYPPSIFFQGMKFMLFGDPSLALRREW